MNGYGIITIEQDLHSRGNVQDDAGLDRDVPGDVHRGVPQGPVGVVTDDEIPSPVDEFFPELELIPDLCSLYVNVTGNGTQQWI